MLPNSTSYNKNYQYRLTSSYFEVFDARNDLLLFVEKN